VDAQLIVAIDRTRLPFAAPTSDGSRTLSAMSWSPRSTRLQPNVFRRGCSSRR